MRTEGIEDEEVALLERDFLRAQPGLLEFLGLLRRMLCDQP